MCARKRKIRERNRMLRETQKRKWRIHNPKQLRKMCICSVLYERFVPADCCNFQRRTSGQHTFTVEPLQTRTPPEC